MVIKFWISWKIDSAVFTCVTMGPPSDKRGIKNTSGNYGLKGYHDFLDLSSFYYVQNCLKYISKFVTAIAILLIVFTPEVSWKKPCSQSKADKKYLILSLELTWKGKGAKNEDEKMQLIEF